MSEEEITRRADARLYCVVGVRVVYITECTVAGRLKPYTVRRRGAAPAVMRCAAHALFFVYDTSVLELTRYG